MDTHTPPATPPASSDLAMLLHERLRAARTGPSPPSLPPLPFPPPPGPLAAMLTRRPRGAPLYGAPVRLPDAAAVLNRWQKHANAGVPQWQRLAQGKASKSRTAALAGCGPWRRPRPGKTEPASVRRSACPADGLLGFLLSARHCYQWGIQGRPVGLAWRSQFAKVFWAFSRKTVLRSKCTLLHEGSLRFAPTAIQLSFSVLHTLLCQLNSGQCVLLAADGLCFILTSPSFVLLATTYIP